MPQDDYERYRQRLEKQLHADIGMLYDAFHAKLRAYETITRARRGDLAPEPLPPPAGAPLPPEAPSRGVPPPVAPRPRSEPFQVIAAIRAALATLPEEFDRFAVLAALDFEPRRSTLHAALTTLLLQGTLEIAQEGGGKRPTLYRRGAAASPPLDS